jgi:leucyl aminopeptidase
VVRLRKQIEEGQKVIAINQFDRQLYFVVPDDKKTGYNRLESLRKAGHELYQVVSKAKVETLQIVSETVLSAELLALTEGLVLSSYQFTKYKTEQKPAALRSVHLQRCATAMAEYVPLTVPPLLYRLRPPPKPEGDWRSCKQDAG